MSESPMGKDKESKSNDFENLLAAADGPGIETYFEAGAEARMRVMGS